MTCAVFQNVPLALVTVGGVIEWKIIFMNVAAGHCVASGTTERNTNTTDNQDETWANDLLPKIASERNSKFHPKLL